MATYRTIDGTDNNAVDGALGSTGDQLLRLTTADYGDGISTLAGATRPGAREISNEIFSQTETTGNANDFSSFLWIWGQFLDHDISLTPPDAAAGTAPIAVPQFDPYFDPAGTGTETIGFTRSGYDPATGITGPRQYTNSITAFIDASNVYGSDAVRAAELRDTGGYLKTSTGDLLPFNTAGLPNDPSPDPSFFLAGDVRASENVALTSMHTLFVREHNRLVDEFSLANPAWSAETLYQEAKKIVEAQMQAITFNEFLPKLIGEDALADYEGYRADVDPQIAVIFSTAAYRVGHTMLSSTVQRLDEDGAESSFGHLALRDAFFRPDRLVNEGGIDDILRGAGVEESETVDTKIIDDVRNFLFGPPGAGGFDLAALNIQRGRDHGLTDYNTAREAYGLARVTSFAEITSDVELQNLLQTVFGTVDNIDVFVGGLAEDHVEGAVVGELFRAVIADQFTRLRDGDSFWYETRLNTDELAMVSSTTLADIIERNSGIGHMQDDVFTSYHRKAGTDGDDFLAGGASNDLLIGKKGKDTLIGNYGNDQLMGDNGADVLYGGAGNDILYGGDQSDELHGETGDDLLKGEAGDDFLAGGTGRDDLRGGDGQDFLAGGDGSDILDGGQGNDFLEGGYGNDRASYASATTSITLDLENPANNTGDAAGDYFVSIEKFLGSSFDDVMTGSVYANMLGGGGGADIINGGKGDDRLMGDAGDDQLRGGGGDDFLSGGSGNDTAVGGTGNDLVRGNSGDDTLKGNAGYDRLEGGSGNDTILGGKDDDRIHGDGGNDTLDGGKGSDRLSGAEGVDTLSGQSGHDFLTGGGDNDILNGGRGNDLLRGNSGDDSLNGGIGNDILSGNVGTDTFIFDIADWGQDTITDFEDGTELIDMRGSGVIAGALVVTTSGTDAIVDFSTGATITLTGQAGNIDAGDFIF